MEYHIVVVCNDNENIGEDIADTLLDTFPGVDTVTVSFDNPRTYGKDRK